MTTLVTRSFRRSRGQSAQDNASFAYWRLIVLVGAFAVFVLLIMVRLAGFAFFESARAFSVTSTDYVPERGDIVDRNNVPMARSIQAYAIWVRPNEIIGDKKQLSHQLAAIFPDTTAQRFFEILSSPRQGYLRKRALPEQVRRVHDLGEVAIQFPREAERLYPQHDMAAHVLGFVNRDGKGAMGMEGALDKRLSDPTLRGTPAALSIDVRVQAALESELASGMGSTGAKGAAGIVLDVQTGEVLAMSTLPSFNPNRPVFANVPDHGETIVDGRYPIDRQINNVTNRVYELGSTFKPLTVAAALDAGTVRDLSLRYDATKPIEIADFKIKDLHGTGRWLNVPEALVHSSNIVTARIADNLGSKRMDAMLKALAFDKRPTIELHEVARPLYPKHWGRITNMTVGYGHGISVTPIHLASAFAAMVNGGMWHPATLLKVENRSAVPARRVFTAATSARMRQLLRMIVVDGTGKKADVRGFRVGGKTGTAEKAGLGGYAKDLIVSTFVAAFPMDNPRYVVVAMLDEPKGTAASGFQRTAGWTSAPIVNKTITRVGPLLGVIPDTKRDVDVSELMPLIWSPKGG